MAKKYEPHSSNGKMTFIMFSLDGGDETLQQSFRTISQALGNAFQRGRPLPNRTLQPTEALPEHEIDADVLEPEMEQLGENGESTGKAKPSRPAKKPTYKTVNDLNLLPEGEESLRDFFKAKNPESQQEQFVAILFYLTKKLKLTGIGPNHIYTAFNNVGKPIPVIRSTAQNIARRRGWIDASDMNDLKMITPGENFVNHDLPRAGVVGSSSEDEE